MTPDEAIAREGIRHTLVSYNMAGDSADTETFVAQFADDAIFETAPAPGVTVFRVEGIEAIRRWAVDWMKRPRTSFVAHNLTTSKIELTGKDTATARTYFTTFRNIGADHAGVYIDKLKRVGDRWLLAHRIVAADWLSPHKQDP